MDQAAESPAAESPAAVAARLRAAFTPAAFRDWAAGAQPMATQIYAIGNNAARDAGWMVATTVRAFAAAGYVQAYSARRPCRDGLLGCGFNYLCRRTAKPWPRDAAMLRTIDDVIAREAVSCQESVA